MKNLITCLVVCVLSGVVAAEVHHVPRDLTITKTLLTPPEVAAFNGVSVEINRDELEALPFGSSITIHDFPLGNDYAVNLTLERFDVFTDDAVVVVASMNQNGRVDEQHIPKPDVILLRGWVEGDENSRCFLALGKQTTNGIIETDSRTYVLAKDKSRGWTVVYNLNDVYPEDMNWKDFYCDVIDTGRSVDEDRYYSPARGNGDCQALQIAVDTDWEFVELFGGNVDAASEYAATLLGGVSTIFEMDVNVQTQISYLRIWNDDSDPWDAGNTESQLYQFRDYWEANMSDVTRHLVHLLSGRSLGGGIAWLSAVCTPYYGYAVSADINGFFPLPLTDHNSNNWDVMVVAHELGHNCGTWHTHDYEPPIDGCGLGDCSDAWGGTIMSYCHLCSGGLSNIVLSFHPIVQVTIENYLANDIACTLDDCSGDPTGACCVGEDCSIMTASDCSSWGGTYLGDNTNCNGDPCYVPPTGACCINEDCSIMTASDCSALDGTYLGDNTNCNGDPCYDPQTGACCLNENCSILTASDCAASGGSFLGDGSNCQGNPCNDGVWNVPGDFPTIQEAIDASSDGDEILVMPGTYMGTGVEVVNLLGKAVWLHSSGGPDVTIIDGETTRRVLLCHSGEDINTTIEGFTITNGSPSSGDDAGGMWNYMTSPRVVNCRFINNTGTHGGAVRNHSSSPTFEDCTFENNTAENGGAMYNNDGANPVLTNCILTGNNAGYRGGGVWNYASHPNFTDCEFNANTSSDRGGGMHNMNSSNPTLTNCTFTGNQGVDGGGMYNNTSSPTLTDNYFERNSASGGGGGIANGYGSNPDLTNCVLKNNTAGFAGGVHNAKNSTPTLTDMTICSNTPPQIYGAYTDNGGNTIEDECPDNILLVPQEYTTIQAAVDAASDGDTINVSPGTYTSDTGEVVFMLGKNIILQSTELHGAVIDGQGTRRGITCTQGEPESTLISGFVIQNCYSGGGGGGFLIDNSSPTISNCKILNNNANNGGGVLAEYCSSTWSDCEFQGNSATDGAGAYFSNQCDVSMTGCVFSNNSASYGGGILFSIPDSSHPSLTGCSFNGNVASSAGGGVYNISGTLSVASCSFTGNSSLGHSGAVRDLHSQSSWMDCVFDSNTAASNGGAVLNDDCNGLFDNCIFTNNTANENGGGMYNQSDTSPTIANCTFIGNEAMTRGGGAIMNIYGSNPLIQDCLFESNSAQEWGGAIHNDASSPVLDSCIFRFNTAMDGGAIVAYAGSNPSLMSCTIRENIANGQGGGIFTYSASVSITETWICSNQPNQIYGDYTDGGGNTIEDECPVDFDCDAADFTGDGIVNINDLLTLIANWNTSSPLGDINEDGIVNVHDLLLLIAAWGPCE